MDVDRYRTLLRSVYGGRRWLVFGGSLAGQADLVADLRALGSEPMFVVANERGLGATPPDEDAESFLLGLRATDAVDELRAIERAVGDRPAEARAAIERWDPDRSARALGRVVLDAVPDVAGRRRWAARPARWRALEDKVAIDAFWDAAGLPRPPSEIVAAERGGLCAAAARLDRGAGTVWAGDARDGLHGGAVVQRWVRTDDEAREAVRFLGARCARVRVAPFLEGLPCSIHGIVFDEAVAVLRPVERITLRRAGESGLLYGGFATTWDPPADERDARRAFARRAGEALRARVDFRGAFTVDGVMTRDGFRPTELNPRVGGALRLFEQASGVPLALLAFAVQERAPLDWRPAEVERLVVDAADARRTGRGFAVLPGMLAREELALARNGDGWRRARDGEEPDAALALGPDRAGGVLRIVPTARGVRVGAPFAPDLVAALALADRELGTSFGAVEAAPEV